MQPYFFPYIGYFQLMHAVDRFVIYDDVSWINRGWINRNRILLGEDARYFTLPARGASQNRRICDIELADVGAWREKFLRSLRHSYARAPYFAETHALIEESCNFATDHLSQFVVHSIERVCSTLGIETDLVPSSSVYENAHLKGPDRILDICAREGAKTYINPIGGRDLYDRDAFKKRGIELSFIETGPVNYRQGAQEFVSMLSIIDVMMFNSPERISELLKIHVLS